MKLLNKVTETSLLVIASNTISGMISALDIHDHAVEDIEAILEDDEDAAAAIIAALEAMRDDPQLIDKVTTRGYNHFGDYRTDVKPWQVVRRFANLWRLRLFDTGTAATRYRVIYGYHYQTRQVLVLAIVSKDDFDYEIDSDIARRILADWAEL